MASNERRERMDLGAALRSLGAGPSSVPDFEAVYAAVELQELFARRRRRLLVRLVPLAASLALGLALALPALKARPEPGFASAAGALGAVTAAAQGVLAPGMGLGNSAIDQFAAETLAPRGPFFETRGSGIEHLVSDYIDQLWEEPGAEL